MVLNTLKNNKTMPNSDNNQSMIDDSGPLSNIYLRGQLTTKEQRAVKRESVRSTIALYYIIGFLVIITFGITIGIFKDYTASDYKDLLIAISGVLSGPLGFIIGFYFKGSSEE